MPQPTTTAARRDEVLWALTGLLLGLALYLVTDLVLSGVVVGVTLAGALVVVERVRRARADGTAGRVAGRGQLTSG
jgi:hypothetical protein